MTNIPVPGYQAFWTNARKTLKSEFQRLSEHPDAEEQLKQLLKVLYDIEDVAGYTSTSVGESKECTNTVRMVMGNRASYCKALYGKNLYSALYGSNSTGPSSKQEGFNEVHRRKRKTHRRPPKV
jgi:hypothetical protein